MAGDERVGSIGEEAAKLLDALRDMFGPGGALGPEHIATGAPECAWCPVCQLIAVVRGDRPEVNEKLAEAGQAMVAAMRTLLAEHANPQPTQEHSARHVQRIDLGDR